MGEEKNLDKNFKITFDIAKTIGYFHIANNVNPIKRLHVKNMCGEDFENVKIKVFSTPDFLLPFEVIQQAFPRKTNVKFETSGKLSPLFMVALDRRIKGEVSVEVWKDDVLLAEQTEETELLAFDECNFTENPESIATFVKRTSEINRFVNSANKKLESWGVPSKGAGYQTNKNAVRNFFAACFSVLTEENFVISEKQNVSEIISSHTEMFLSKIASPLELALFISAMIEANGQNSLIGKFEDKWYVGCFLTNDCFPNVINDDAGIIRKKAEIRDISLICASDIIEGISFEKAEKSAVASLKKVENVDFFIDVKRARIMHYYPLPDRIMKPDGYDLRQSSDFSTNTVPTQIKEYKGNIGGDKEISRVTQWERRLLDMDMRNSLLNFKVSQTSVKLLIPSLEDLIENLDENLEFSLESRPKDGAGSNEKMSASFEMDSYLKPFTDYTLYEIKNKRLHSVFDTKEHESTLLRLFRKEQSIQEETGTMTLYLAAGFLKWTETEGEPKYAPILLYPATISKKGLSTINFNLTINYDDAHINSTLLEFLYQEFNLDMRGLQTVELNNSKDILSIFQRIRKEIVNFAGWEVLSNVFLATLSFANYQLWYDVKYRADKFKENKLISSLINNRLELESDKFEMSDKSSDNAYLGTDHIFLPISADSSQYSAIYDSLNKSFVLHGPPGTGKSQTITNIIANNIVKGRRVLFVAEKMAALSVVYRRLQNIGLGDFCLELHSNKTDKIAILSQIIKTLSLVDNHPENETDGKAEELAVLIGKLQAELDAMHKKRYLGFSLYEAILNYFDNQDAPECLRIDSLFFEKLTETSFNNYLDVLTELSLRAQECGDIDKSPFKHIGRFGYSEVWRKKAENILEIYLLELKHLRQYAKNLLPLFNMRTVSLTKTKIEALYNISNLLKEKYSINYFKHTVEIENAKGIIDSFNEALKKNSILMSEFTAKYGAYPQIADIELLKKAQASGNYHFSIRKVFPQGLEKQNRSLYLEFLIKCETNRLLLEKRTIELANIFELPAPSLQDVSNCVKKINSLYLNASKLYADFDSNLFDNCCYQLTKYDINLYLDYFVNAYDNNEKAKNSFNEIFFNDGYLGGEEINATIDYVNNIQKNIDFIPSWCKYQEIVDKCRKNGFEFILEPLNVGEITATDILRCFKKCVYYNFIRSELYLDEVLCQFSGLTMEETANRFKDMSEEYEKLSRQDIYNQLIANLPRPEATGDHNLERVLLMRAEKTNMKGTTLRNLFRDVPNILKTTCPCMLMSPTSVSQFLDIDMDKFDLVVFDEASQIPTCKAIGSIVRSKEAIIVGDPKQLPPTSFFSSDFKDDEHYEVEDLESILDDCLALGMPENHLLWHYRSNHESLIAFSNAMYYDNTLLTFPSPNEMNSKVSFRYVDGIYERGGSKCNKKEGDELIAEVINRLKDPATKTQSIGVVTFNTAQQNYIENALSKQIHLNGLDAVAYDTEEPLFVKNLENVQGDERDIILFSVGYGPDKDGKLSLNFGPINQSGGYKRLNVAVSRARNEMKVFSAITGNMIDLSRSDSKGVKGLKAFLEYAERGRDTLAIDSSDVSGNKNGIGELIAKDLKDRGILCDYNIGVSDFKIDVAVVDPRNKDKYILAVICDSENACKLKGVKDRVAMQTKVLKKLGWNTYQLWTVNYFNNPKREVTKIKDFVSALTEKKVMNKKAIREITTKYRKNYRAYYSKALTKAGADYVLNFVNEEKILSKIRELIETESPLEEQYLLDKLLVMFNIPKNSKRAVATITDYLHSFASFQQDYFGKSFFADKAVDTFRPNDTKTTRDLAKIHPYEIIAAIKLAIETKINPTKEDVIKEVSALFNVSKRTKTANDWISQCLDLALKENSVMSTVEGYLTT